jgi:methylated-DNA-[protein]-cysteine S-methyltransferase
MTPKLRDLTLDRMASPIGDIQLVTDDQGVVRALDFSSHDLRMRTLMGRYYRGVELKSGVAPGRVRDAVSAYFEGQIDALDDVAWATNGTAFQQSVWAGLCTIPVGETLSYKGLAERVGRPSAMRAVGMANGANPVAIIVPCHRVIGADLSLTGYGGGLERKRWLLRHEGARFRDQGQDLPFYA